MPVLSLVERTIVYRNDCLFLGSDGICRLCPRSHFPSSIAFMLAIASRQYMLAFPAALATYEFAVCALEVWRTRRLDLAKQKRWLAPAIAAMSILGWIYLFQGLAPETAIESRAPQVQKKHLDYNSW
ncbi:hypothetical protein HC928_23955 [bacterium]|nr:hypothetical protein [bacterium]